MVILIQDRQRCGVGRTRPCFIFNDAALGLVARRRRVSKRMDWEEVAYTPAFERRLLLPSVASSFEPRPVCLRRVAWSPTLFPTWGVYLTVFRREVEAKEIDVAVVITFDAKSSEAEILVHHIEDK